MRRLENLSLYHIGAEELIAELDHDVNDIIDKVQLITDPVIKETRTFDVYPFPWLVHIIMEYLDSVGEPGMSDAWSLYKQRAPDILLEDIPPYVHSKNPIAQLVLSPLRVFHKNLPHDRESIPLFIAKCSRRTMIKGNTLSLHIAGLINRSTVGGRVPRITELYYQLDKESWSRLFEVDPLVHEHGRFPIVQQLLPDLLNPELDLVERIRTLRLRLGWPDDPRTLRMKTKLYVARADTRAYYVDTNPLRHLSGSVLLHLISGTNLDARKEIRSERWLPARGKNELTHEVEMLDGDRLLVVLGDISSFTNSNVNSWVLQIALLTLLARHPEIGDAILAYTVEGRCFTTTPTEALLIYLFTCIGASATLPSQEPYIATGGYLGVKSNITFSSMVFAIIVDTIAVVLSNKYTVQLRMHGQIGGDDFALFFVSSDVDVLYDAQREFLDLIKQYVGQLKDPTTFLVPDSPGAFELPGRFCKKKVVVTVRAPTNPFVTLIQSVEKLPLLRNLFEAIKPSPAKKTLKQVRGIIASLRSSLSGMDGKWVLEDAYMLEINYVYNLHKRYTLSWRRQAVHSGSVTIIESALVSTGVSRLLARFPILHADCGTPIARGNRDRLRVLGAAGKIAVKRVLILPHRTDGTIYIKEGEESQLETDCHLYTVIDPIPSEFSDTLSVLFRRLRRVVVQITRRSAEIDHYESSDSDDSVEF